MGITEISLEKNRFSGSLVIKNDRLPHGITTINAQGNQFNALAVVASETGATILLRGSGVTSVVDEHGKKQDLKRFFM